MFTALIKIGMLVFFCGLVISGRSQANCTVFKDSSHIKACRLYNAADSFPQGSALSQHYLDSAIHICPDYANAWREISVPYLKRGDFPTWRNYIDKAVTLQPRLYLGVRGWCRYKFLHDFEGALQDLQQLDTLTSGEPGPSGDGSYNLYIVMALCERGLGNYDAAFHYFALGIDSVRARQGPIWVGFYDYVHRAVLRMKQGDYRGALNDLDLQMEKTDKYAETAYYRGLAFAALGRTKEARAALQKARALFITDGYHFSDVYCEVQDEVYLEDIDRALEHSR
jgi:tetratricopeptide (TPR) repeat protein